MAVHRAPVRLPEFCTECIAPFRAHAPQITIEADDEAAQIDPVLMRQAVRNLLDNAFRHAPGTPVLLRAATIDHHVTLCVSDAGRGLPEHLRGRLSCAETGAGGLGLSIVAAIADAHGGYVEAGVESDGGTRITIVVPNEANDVECQRVLASPADG